MNKEKKAPSQTQDQNKTQEVIAQDQALNNQDNASKTPKTKAFKPTFTPKRTSSSKSLAIVAIMALITAFISLGGVFFIWYEAHSYKTQRDLVWKESQSANDVNTQISNLNTKNEELSQQLQAQTRQLISLQDKFTAEDLSSQRRLVAQLQGDTQDLASRLERTLGANRDDWRLVEAESLVRLAIIRTQTMQDAQSARLLLQTADDILRKQDDNGAFAAREKLAESMEQLQVVAEFDRTGLYLQLSAVRNLVEKLDEQPKFIAHQADANLPSYDNWWGEITENYSNWQYWLRKLDNYVRIDFSVNPTNSAVIASHNFEQSKLALMLSLEQASWAVLNTNGEIYLQTLQQGQHIIAEGFDQQNQTVQNLKQRLQELQKIEVTFNAPDLNPCLKAVQNYIVRRNSLRQENQADNNDKLHDVSHNLPSPTEQKETKNTENSTNEQLDSPAEVTDETL